VRELVVGVGVSLLLSAAVLPARYKTSWAGADHQFVNPFKGQVVYLRALVSTVVASRLRPTGLELLLVQLEHAHSLAESLAVLVWIRVLHYVLSWLAALAAFV
jgi:hypothetical protein